MAALQRKLRFLIMVKSRRLPSLLRMAVGAVRLSWTRVELTAVRIFVASLAGLWRSFELNQCLPQRRFVACSTRHRTMRPA